jgi:transposase
MAATEARSWTGRGSTGASRSRWSGAATADGSGAGCRPGPRPRSCPRSRWSHAGGWWSGTFAWLGRFRRLSKDYEYLTATSEAVIYLAMTRMLLRRLTRH